VKDKKMVGQLLAHQTLIISCPFINFHTLYIDFDKWWFRSDFGGKILLDLKTIDEFAKGNILSKF